MPDIYKTIKKTWLKSMVVVGTAASNIANSSKQKVSEMNLEGRRREMLADISVLAYEMWQKGMVFPSPLNERLEELSKIDEEINALRAQRYAAMPEEHEPTNGAGTPGEPARIEPVTDSGNDDTGRPIN